MNPFGHCSQKQNLASTSGPALRRSKHTQYSKHFPQQGPAGRSVTLLPGEKVLRVFGSSRAESKVTWQLHADCGLTATAKARWCVWSTCWADFKEALVEVDESPDEQRRHGGAAIRSFISDTVRSFPLFLFLFRVNFASRHLDSQSVSLAEDYVSYSS